MNFSKILLLFFAFIIFNSYADIEIITRFNEEQLTEALCKKELSVNNTILYGNNIYTITAFEIKENNGFYDIFIALQRQLVYLCTIWGDEYVKIKVTKEYDNSKTHNTEILRHIKLNKKCQFLGATLYFAIIGFIIKLGIGTIYAKRNFWEF